MNSKLSTQSLVPVSQSSGKRRWFGEGELKCQGPGCGRSIPAGFYGKYKNVYLCSGSCSYRYHLQFRPIVTCACGCGTRFLKKSNRKGLKFVDHTHLAAWRQKRLDQKKVGRFTPLLYRYMETCAPKQYAPATLLAVRCNLAAFFSYLNRRKIRSLESVKPSTITAFLNDLMQTRRKSAGVVVTGTVRHFFDWLLLIGKRRTPNPVIPSFHSQRRSKRLPRPYEPSDMELISSLLEAENDLVLTTSVSLGEESGGRISEICNLRVQDVDLEGQQIFIRLPTKVGLERYAPFHTKSKNLLVEWLAERGAREHDYLFVRPDGKPMRPHNLRNRLNKVLCGPGKLPSFSFHRLRARAATRIARGGADLGSVMQLFGWRNPAVAAGYIAYLQEDLRAEYARSMEKRNADAVPEPKTVSLKELFADPIDTPSKPA